MPELKNRILVVSANLCRRALYLACLSASLILTGSLIAEPAYVPPGHGAGQNAEGTGFGFDFGYKQIGEDYYITVNPMFEFPLGKLRIGLQIPLEILAYDVAPKGDQKPPAIRKGTFDEIEDYSKLIQYVRYGTHLFYDPDDLFNWSFFYGKMNNGYIGHKTIIHRYVTTYDATIHRAGLMADINNRWGGIEYFSSDTFRREVVGTRAYIRPFGVFYGVHDLFFAHGGVPSARNMAISLDEQRDPEKNGGVFFQEATGGAMRHSNLKKIGDEDFSDKSKVKFVEETDPETGKTSVRAVPVAPESGGSTTNGGTPTGTGGTGGTGGTTTGTGGTGGTGGTTGGTTGDGRKEPAPIKDNKEDKKDSKSSPWGPTFWSRWAIGYTIVRDLNAPLTLDRDGSGNLVIDPDTKRPREKDVETLTIVGMDTEFRASPFRWLELTPYLDINRVKDLNNSKGIHAGIDTEFKLFGNFLKLTFRPEYREITSNYLPSYFDAYYSMERTTYVPGGSTSNTGEVTDNSMPKLEYLKSLPDDGAKAKGYFVQFMFEILQNFVLEATYENYEGLNNSRIFVGVYVPNIAGFFLNGYYTKKNFDLIQESFEFDDRSLMAGEAGYIFYGAFFVKIGYQRTWEYNASSSAYEAKSEKTVNFGFSSSM